MATISGSCLCGTVRYRVDGPIGRASHCHCSRCRKAHGAAFGTYAPVAREDFVVVSGAESIRSYASSSRVTRTFCERCGSTLQFIENGAPTIELALGTLDDDPGTRPSFHIFVDSRAPWYEIHDDLPRHATWPKRRPDEA